MRHTATDTFIQLYDSPLGELVMSSDGSALTGLGLASQRAAVATAADARPREESLLIFRETARWLETYFRGRAPSFTPKLKLSGSDFQKLRNHAHHPVRGNRYLWGNRCPNSAGERNPAHVRAGSRGSGRSKSDSANCSLSPGNRGGRQPHWLWRRHRAKNPAAKTRKSRYGKSIFAQGKVAAKIIIGAKEIAAAKETVDY